MGVNLLGQNGELLANWQLWTGASNTYLHQRIVSNRIVIMMSKRRRSFSDEVRQAVDASDMSRYRICQEIDLNQSTMSRFMAGRSGLSLDTLDRLAVVLDLHVVASKRRRKGR